MKRPRGALHDVIIDLAPVLPGEFGIDELLNRWPDELETPTMNGIKAACNRLRRWGTLLSDRRGRRYWFKRGKSEFEHTPGQVRWECYKRDPNGFLDRLVGGK